MNKKIIIALVLGGFVAAPGIGLAARMRSAPNQRAAARNNNYNNSYNQAVPRYDSGYNYTQPAYQTTPNYNNYYPTPQVNNYPVYNTSNTSTNSGIFSGTASTPGSLLNFLLGDPCLVPVYHTDFIFPAEGGAVIQQGNQLFFVPTYQPGCSSYLSRGTVVKTAGQTNAPVVQPTGTAGGNLLNFAVGDPCLVPVFTTNFAFPVEGGHIIQQGNQMYFAKTYLPGCQNSTNGASIIK
jgi:hypothetical protein